MGIKITRFPDLPVVMFESVLPFNPTEDPVINLQETAKLKHELGRPVYRIIDISTLDLSFSDMALAMAAERGHEGGSGDADVTTLFVADSELVELGTKALAEQEQYGKAKVHLFKSRDAALDFVRQQEGK